MLVSPAPSTFYSRYLKGATKRARRLYARQGDGKGARHPHALQALAVLADVTAMKVLDVRLAWIASTPP